MMRASQWRVALGWRQQTSQHGPSRHKRTAFSTPKSAVEFTASARTAARRIEARYPYATPFPDIPSSAGFALWSLLHQACASDGCGGTERLGHAAVGPLPHGLTLLTTRPSSQPT